MACGALLACARGASRPPEVAGPTVAGPTVAATAPLAPLAADATAATLALPDGRAATYRVELPAAPLVAAVAYGDGALALTATGALVAYDRALRPGARPTLGAPIRGLTAARDGAIYTVDAAGAVARRDAVTLTATTVAVAANTPLWIGHGPAGLVVVAASLGSVTAQVIGPASAAAIPLAGLGEPAWAGLGLAGWPAERLALDGAGRLWAMTGRTAAAFDLSSGARIAEVAIESGVRGLAAVGDGVWAYGSSGADGALLRALPDDAAIAIAPTLPDRPLTLVRATPAGVLAAIGNQIYRRVPATGAWERRATLPRSVPARDVVALIATGDDGLLVVTDDDGLARIADGTVTIGPAPPRLTRAGELRAFGDGWWRIDGASVERAVGDAWAPVALPDELARRRAAWIDAGASGPYAIAPGDALITARWAGDRMVVVGRQPGPPAPPAVARHALWETGPPAWRLTNVVASGDRLFGFDDEAMWQWDAGIGTWTAVARRPAGLRSDHRLEVIATGPRWLLFDRADHALFELTTTGADRGHLTQVLADRRVDAAVAASADVIVVSADGALFRLIRPTGDVVRWPIDIAAAHLARDRRGRIWFASNLGLGVLEARDTSTLALPPLVGQRIDALLADPDGDVAIALAGGGLVRVTLPDAD